MDDEPGVLKSTELLLLDCGFDVLTTSQHTDVIPLLRQHRPAVLLQDVRMPGLEVERLVASIRADPEVRSTPIVLFSASMEITEISGRVPVDGILEKPFMPDEVVDAIQRAAKIVPLGGAA